MTDTFDVVVIGGGIAGVSATYELTLAGRRVLLVEREGQLAYHTTGRSAALFLESYGPPIVRALLSESRQFLEEAPERLDIAEVLTPRLSLYVSDHEHTDVVAKMLAESPLVEDVGIDGAVEVCPAIKAEAIGAAILEPGAGSIDVMGLHQGFVKGAVAAGAQIEKWYDVNRITRHAAGGFTVGSSSGRSAAAAEVVLAGGAWTDELGRLAGARPLGLQPKRRTIAVCPTNFPFRTTTHVSDVTERYYWQPEGPNIQLSLADETPSEPCDARPEELDVAMAIEEVNQATHLALRSVITSWAGLRTFAPDRRPVNGADPDIDGLWWLCGQGGWGIETSPAMARTLCHQMTVGGLPAGLLARGVEVGALSPARLR